MTTVTTTKKKMTQGGEANGPACADVKIAFNQAHNEVLRLSFQQQMSMGNGWSNETMTDQTVAKMALLCQAAGGRFTATQLAILDCSNTKIAYHNVADCFPDTPVCADFTLGTFAPALLAKMHTKCTLRSEVLRETIPDLQPRQPPWR